MIALMRDELSRRLRMDSRLIWCAVLDLAVSTEFAAGVKKE